MCRPLRRRRVPRASRSRPDRVLSQPVLPQRRPTRYPIISKTQILRPSSRLNSPRWSERRRRRLSRRPCRPHLPPVTSGRRVTGIGMRPSTPGYPAVGSRLNPATTSSPRAGHFVRACGRSCRAVGRCPSAVLWRTPCISTAGGRATITAHVIMVDLATTAHVTTMVHATPRLPATIGHRGPSRRVHGLCQHPAITPPLRAAEVATSLRHPRVSTRLKALAGRCLVTMRRRLRSVSMRHRNASILGVASVPHRLAASVLRRLAASVLHVARAVAAWVEAVAAWAGAVPEAAAVADLTRPRICVRV